MGLSMADPNFAAIVTKADNVPIVGLVYLLGFFTWLATAQAVDNDDRIAQGLEPRGKAGQRKSAGLARPGLHRTDLHGRHHGLVAVVGIGAAWLRWRSRPAA